MGSSSSTPAIATARAAGTPSYEHYATAGEATGDYYTKKYDYLMNLATEE
jgi:hypothetical protein